MDQKTFHALYLKTPEGFKAELIGGTVYVMSSPVSLNHGKHHSRLVRFLCTYADNTPGIEIGDNTTNVLSEESEPQPDAFLVIEPEYGGQTTLNKDGYVVGGPELVAEVANSTASIDLNRKKADYEKAGVGEYLVVLVREKSVVCFGRGGRHGGFLELKPGSDGVIRSGVLPGLWLDLKGLFERPPRRLYSVLNKGLASPEHAAFVAELNARRKKGKSAARKPSKK
jgi:Uma2 family endonuclease